MKIVFFGSDELAVVSLEALLKIGHEIAACVTPPDRAKGRGLKVTPSPVKAFAQKHGIHVWQPADLHNPHIVKKLRDAASDVFVVIAYGKVLPDEILKIPKHFSVNVHGSLLPQYRGAAPVNWAIINGEKETGVSIIRMNASLDAGDILAQDKITIDEDDTAVTLRAKVAKAGAECLVRTLRYLEKNPLRLIPQDPKAVTRAPKLTKAHGLIDWNRSANEIHNLVRGLLPWPGAYTHYQGKLLKILQSETLSTTAASSAGRPASAGTVVAVSKMDFTVQTGKGLLAVKTVHPEAGKAMDAKSFAVGHHLQSGDRLGK